MYTNVTVKIWNMAIAAASCCRPTPFGHGSPENHIQCIQRIQLMGDSASLSISIASGALMLQACRGRLDHLLVCLSVCPESVLWQNGRLYPNAIWDGEWGWSRNGCIRGVTKYCSDCSSRRISAAEDPKQPPNVLLN